MVSDLLLDVSVDYRVEYLGTNATVLASRSLSEANMLQVRGWPLRHIIEIGAAFEFRDAHDAKQQLHSVAYLMGEDWGQDTTEEQDLITARKHFPEKVVSGMWIEAQLIPSHAWSVTDASSPSSHNFHICSSFSFKTTELL